ncbi:hypothetical protein ACFSTE_21930 [Aquimarina hainanensis]|uniref:Uncharacterized protein n=1 Tax=Aquimarina hainanensis TaxID=1578017 RepID=A0ABW5NGZ3_9FLAO|nr:hypothetical protein [Aquimarina sp. TRL1]QKX07363.1 hypothetical protein HN014_21420 [Aquimarina sp. TRL1]
MSKEELYKVMLAYKNKHGFTESNQSNFIWAIESLKKHTEISKLDKESPISI